MFKIKSGTKFVYSIRGHNNFYYPDLESTGFLTKDCVATPMNWVCSSHSAVLVPMDDDSGPKIPIWIEKDLFNALKNSGDGFETPDDEFISLKTLNKIIGVHVSRWVEDQVYAERERSDIIDELIDFSRDNFSLNISSNSEIKCPQCHWGGSSEHLEVRFTAKLCPICRVVLVNR